MKVILCPDSYKNNISSVELCEIMKEAILDVKPETKVLSVPIADGGEGTLDSISLALSSQKEHFGNFEGDSKNNEKSKIEGLNCDASDDDKTSDESLSDISNEDKKSNESLSDIEKSKAKYKLISASVAGPFLEPIRAKYLFNGTCAIIESAKVIGISLVGENRNVKKTSSYGLGQLIKHALSNGAKTIILALGGSSTNDLGVGMASALGYKFLDKDNRRFIPTAQTLGKVAAFDYSDANKDIFNTTFITMVDCNNPLIGKDGATYVYAKQKGASDEDLPFLESNMCHIATILSKTYGKDFVTMKGAGAAGGLGAATKIFLGAKLQSGIDTLLNLISFDKMLENTDLVITGEGRFDYQSLMGKAISGIAKRAKNEGVKVIVIAGQADVENYDDFKDKGIDAAYSINESDMPKEEKIKRSREDVYLTTKKAFENFLNK